MASISKYAKQLAQTKVEEMGLTPESEERTILSLQEEITQELESKAELFKQGYEVLIAEAQAREEHDELTIPQEVLDVLEEETQEPEAPPPTNPGLDGFIEPGKIIFRP